MRTSTVRAPCFGSLSSPKSCAAPAQSTADARDLTDVPDDSHVAVDHPDQDTRVAESAEGDRPLPVQVEGRLVPALRIIDLDPVEDLVDADCDGDRALTKLSLNPWKG